MGYLCGLNYLKNKTNSQSDRISLKRQKVTNSIALCSWERWEKLWFQTPKKKINVSQVPLRKHICTLSAGRINTWLFFLPFHKEQWWGETTSWPLPGLFHWQHLQVEGWALGQPQCGPQISHQMQSSKKTNSIFILSSAHRQENKQGKRVSALNVIWWAQFLKVRSLGLTSCLTFPPSSNSSGNEEDKVNWHVSSSCFVEPGFHLFLPHAKFLGFINFLGVSVSDFINSIPHN